MIQITKNEALWLHDTHKCVWHDQITRTYGVGKKYYMVENPMLINALEKYRESKKIVR